MVFFIWLTHAISASSFTATKLSLDYVSPYVLVMIRHLMNGFMLFIPHYLWGTSLSSMNRSFWRSVLLLSLIVAYIPFVFDYWSMNYISSIKGCLLFSFSPFITVILEYFILKKSITLRQFLGLCIGFLGFIPVLMDQSSSEEIMGSFLSISVPEMGMLCSVVSCAYGWIMMKNIIIQYAYSYTTLNCFSMFFGGLIASLVNLILYYIGYIGGTSIEWIPTIMYPLFLSLTSTVSVFLYGQAVNNYSATFVSLTALSTPLFAALFGYIFIGESLTKGFFVSMLLLSLGLYIFYLDEEKSDIMAS